jgi:hypothetical protein
MKTKFLLTIIIASVGVAILSSCVDFYHGKRPIDYPNTRWVSQNPDIFFEVGWCGRITYAQITVNGEVTEIDVIMGVGMGGGVDLRLLPTERAHLSYSWEGRLIRGRAKFGEYKMVVSIIDNNSRGLIDGSITEIIFVIEKMDDPRYVTGRPSGGVWLSEELGITVDFDDHFDESGDYFRGTVIIGNEVREIVCVTRIHGAVDGGAIFSFVEYVNRRDREDGRVDRECENDMAMFRREQRFNINHTGFFKFRYDLEDTMIFVSGLSYTFVRQKNDVSDE